MYVRMLGRERDWIHAFTLLLLLFEYNTRTHTYTHVCTHHTHTHVMYTYVMHLKQLVISELSCSHMVLLFEAMSPLWWHLQPPWGHHKGVATSYSKWHQCCDVAQSSWLQWIQRGSLWTWPATYDRTTQAKLVWKWSQMVVKATIIAMHVGIPRSLLCCCLHNTKVTDNCTSDGNQFLKQ